VSSTGTAQPEDAEDAAAAAARVTSDALVRPASKPAGRSSAGESRALRSRHALEEAAACAVLVDLDEDRVYAAVAGHTASSPGAAVVVLDACVSVERSGGSSEAHDVREAVGQRGIDAWSPGGRFFRTEEGLTPKEAVWGLPVGFEYVGSRARAGLSLLRLRQEGFELRGPGGDADVVGDPREVRLAGGAAPDGDEDDDEDDEDDEDGLAAEPAFGDGDPVPAGFRNGRVRLAPSESCFPLCRVVAAAVAAAIGRCPDAPASTFVVMALPQSLSDPRDRATLVRAAAAGAGLPPGRVHVVPRTVAAVAGAAAADPLDAGAALPAQALPDRDGDEVASLRAADFVGRAAGPAAAAEAWSRVTGRRGVQGAAAPPDADLASSSAPLGRRLGLLTGLGLVSGAVAAEAAVVWGGFVPPSGLSASDDDDDAAAAGGARAGSPARGAPAAAPPAALPGGVIRTASSGAWAAGGKDGLTGDDAAALPPAADALAVLGLGPCTTPLDARAARPWLARPSGRAARPVPGRAACVDPAGGLSFALARVMATAALARADVGGDLARLLGEEALQALQEDAGAVLRSARPGGGGPPLDVARSVVASLVAAVVRRRERAGAVLRRAASSTSEVPARGRVRPSLLRWLLAEPSDARAGAAASLAPYAGPSGGAVARPWPEAVLAAVLGAPSSGQDLRAALGSAPAAGAPGGSDRVSMALAAASRGPVGAEDEPADDVVAAWAGVSDAGSLRVASVAGRGEDCDGLAPAAAAALARCVLTAATRAGWEVLGAVSREGGACIASAGVLAGAPAVAAAVAIAVAAAHGAPRALASLPFVLPGTEGPAVAVVADASGAAGAASLQRAGATAAASVIPGLVVLARCLVQPDDVPGATCGPGVTYTSSILRPRQGAWDRLVLVS